MQPKVYIVGGNGNGYGRMFLNAGWELAKGPLLADMIQFTGGEDVTPALFGEENHPYTGNSFERDLYEAGYFAIAQRMGIPMSGICRGGQFLNVMSGGRMYQHVSAHATGKDHKLTDLASSRVIEVSSTHHQMMRSGPDGILVAVADLGGLKEMVTQGQVIRQDDIEVDTESVYYPTTKALCFQPHPEFFQPGHECFEYYFELIERVHGLRA
jgi:hypothetical protein